MVNLVSTDLCVIGAGSGGLTVAAGAVQMGARVVLIEQGRMGGDCLNYGCVPSKSLIAAGRVAHSIRNAGRFGVNGHEPSIDFLRVHNHVKGVIAAIAPHDSQERFERLGVNVIRARARFIGPQEVEAGGQRIPEGDGTGDQDSHGSGRRWRMPHETGFADDRFAGNLRVIESHFRHLLWVRVGEGPEPLSGRRK